MKPPHPDFCDAGFMDQFPAMETFTPEQRQDTMPVAAMVFMLVFARHPASTPVDWELKWPVLGTIIRMRATELGLDPVAYTLAIHQITDWMRDNDWTTILQHEQGGGMACFCTLPVAWTVLPDNVQNN